MITKDMCNMLDVVIQAGLAPSKWSHAISIPLANDQQGRPNINNTLIQVDYNLVLKDTHRLL